MAQMIQQIDLKKIDGGFSCSSLGNGLYGVNNVFIDVNNKAWIAVSKLDGMNAPNAQGYSKASYSTSYEPNPNYRGSFYMTNSSNFMITGILAAYFGYALVRS